MKKEILLDDFDKIIICIGKIISAEKIPKSQKLLKIIVDIGKEKRQIVSGLASDYEINDLIEQKVALVSNLKAVKLHGILSHGMLLATKAKNGKMRLLQAGSNIKNGQIIQ